MNKLSKILIVLVILLTIALSFSIGIALYYRENAYRNLHFFLDKTKECSSYYIKSQELEEQVNNLQKQIDELKK